MLFFAFSAVIIAGFSAAFLWFCPEYLAIRAQLAYTILIRRDSLRKKGGFSRMIRKIAHYVDSLLTQDLARQTLPSAGMVVS